MKVGHDLEQRGIDYFTSLARSGLGLVPYAGSFLAEIIGTVVPNQRLDRVVRYLKTLDTKVAELTTDIEKQELSTNKSLILLFEQSVIFASQTESEEKYKWYASFVVEAIREKSVEAIQKERILSILGELNEVEIIILLFYGLRPTIGVKNSFIERHKDKIRPKYAHVGSPIEDHYDREFHEQYLEHLERLGLIDRRVEINRELETVSVDSSSGRIKKSSASITILGDLFVQFIGGIPNED